MFVKSGRPAAGLVASGTAASQRGTASPAHIAGTRSASIISASSLLYISVLGSLPGLSESVGVQRTLGGVPRAPRRLYSEKNIG